LPAFAQRNSFVLVFNKVENTLLLNFCLAMCAVFRRFTNRMLVLSQRVQSTSIKHMKFLSKQTQNRWKFVIATVRGGCKLWSYISRRGYILVTKRDKVVGGRFLPNCCLSFSFQGGHQALKNKLVKNRPFSYSTAASQELRTRLRLWALGSSHVAKKKRNSVTITKQIASFTLFD